MVEKSWMLAVETFQTSSASSRFPSLSTSGHSSSLAKTHNNWAPKTTRKSSKKPSLTCQNEVPAELEHLRIVGHAFALMVSVCSSCFLWSKIKILGLSLFRTLFLGLLLLVYSGCLSILVAFILWLLVLSSCLSSTCEVPPIWSDFCNFCDLQTAARIEIGHQWVRGCRVA